MQSNAFFFYSQMIFVTNHVHILRPNALRWFSCLKLTLNLQDLSTPQPLIWAATAFLFAQKLGSTLLGREVGSIYRYALPWKERSWRKDAGTISRPLWEVGQGSAWFRKSGAGHGWRGWQMEPSACPSCHGDRGQSRGWFRVRVTRDGWKWQH